MREFFSLPGPFYDKRLHDLNFGIVCAGIGGEFFVGGAVGGAHWARISPGIVGATVAAFATSSPELSVSINAAIAGDRQIALGDGLGSNVVLRSFADTTRLAWERSWAAIIFNGFNYCRGGHYSPHSRQ